MIAFHTYNKILLQAGYAAMPGFHAAAVFFSFLFTLLFFPNNIMNIILQERERKKFDRERGSDIGRR